MKKKYEEWKSLFVKFAREGIVDPSQNRELKEKQSHLGLSESEVLEIKEECLAENGLSAPMESVWLQPRAKELAEHFNKHKFAYAKEFAKAGDGSLPSFSDITFDAANSMLMALMRGGKSAHACLEANKFWIEDNETREIRESSLPEIVALAEKISADKDLPLHKEIIKAAFWPKEILLPADVRYVFSLPEGTEPDYNFPVYDKDGSLGLSLEKRSAAAISRCFQWPSDVVELKTSWVEGRHKILATFRHHFAVSKKTDYSNLNYAEIEDKLQSLCGRSLSEEFGNGEKVLFSELMSFRPERFVSPKTGRDVVVDERAAKKFAMTPEKYSLALDLAEVKKSGSTVANEVKRFMTEKADYEAVLEENPALKKWADSVVKNERGTSPLGKTAKSVLMITSVTPKEKWNAFVKANPGKTPAAASDVYQLEADKSGQRGILHFSHELRLSFDLEASGKPRFLWGDEIAAEYVEYSQEDWDYLKERFPGIEDEASAAIENFFIKNELKTVLESKQSRQEDTLDNLAKENEMESESDELDNKVARAGMHILRESGLDELDSDDYWYARDAVEDVLRAYFERSPLSAGGRQFDFNEDHGAISDYLALVLFNGAGTRVLSTAENPSELLDSLRSAFANELDISFPSERFYVQPEGDKFARTVEDVPAWAVPYLANGESDSLTEEDKQLADKFMEDNGFGELLDASNGYSEQTYFRSRPAFGPACECVDANFSLKEASREIKDSKEIEFRSKEEIFKDFVKRVKDGLSGADRKAVSAVLTAAKEALASFPDGEKTAIGEFLSKKGAKDEESLKKILGSAGRKERSSGRGRKPTEMSR